jgi:LmbE family N-acetylglucosaminyl deacetylase
MDVVFVSPHPDDVEFACFGTLLKHKERGDRIIYLAVSECSDLPRNKNLASESRKVIEFIKPFREIRLDLPNRRVYDTENRETLRKALEDIRDSNDVAMIYSPWQGDINQDHRATAEEVIRVFRYNTILQFEITHSCPGFTPNYYEEISEEHRAKKMEIIQFFKSQMEKSYATPRWIEGVMLFRGLESGVKYAEAFMLWRTIRRL